ncbi:hypothetical protein Nepgr_026310 [Nepenthes gracilis]|uniref:Uncharacterized protein n=1 Tax=Nepenthes gracilis TaxID=150966 RepID=A0AAD3T9I0_NEPGR|nr:hypothetical protein Nepgr_026310 [Nepenthes gracilis]
MPKGTDTSRPLVINAGIKEGVNVPEGGIGKFSIAHVQPAEILSNLGNIACSVSLPTLLQLTVYKNWFSTFYRPNGCSPLQDYYDSMENGYLEDNVEALMECSVRGPVEEYCSLGTGANKDIPGTSENNLLKKKEGEKHC